MAEKSREVSSLDVMVKQLALVLMGLVVLVLILVVAGAVGDRYYTARAAEQAEQLDRQDAFASGMTYEEYVRRRESSRGADLLSFDDGTGAYDEHAAEGHEGHSDAQEATDWAAAQQAAPTQQAAVTPQAQPPLESPPTPQISDPRSTYPPVPLIKGQMILPPPPIEVSEADIAAMAGKAVVINTTLGSIPIEMLPEAAPETVKNFLFLVKNGFYNGLYFHRVLPGVCIQSGSPNGRRGGTAGYWMPMEHSEAFPVMGSICMLPGLEDDLVSSEFVIFTRAGDVFDNQVVPFGRILDRFDVAEKIADSIFDKDGYVSDHTYITSIDIVDRKDVAPAQDYWATYGK